VVNRLNRVPLESLSNLYTFCARDTLERASPTRPTLRFPRPSGFRNRSRAQTRHSPPPAALSLRGFDFFLFLIRPGPGEVSGFPEMAVVAEAAPSFDPEAASPALINSSIFLIFLTVVRPGRQNPFYRFPSIPGQPAMVIMISQGAMALGGVIWGSAATIAGASSTLLWAAVLFLGTLVLVRRLSINVVESKEVTPIALTEELVAA